MSDTQMSSAQICELNIMQHILNICSAHKIEYFILGGTLLGAIRHKGFIPWDDDIDIGMPRPDYNRFIEYAKTELKAPYAIDFYQRGANRHQQYFAKVTDERVKVRLINTDYKNVVPVWVDIFPLDGVPESKATLFRWKNHCLLLAKLFTLSQIKYQYDRKVSVSAAKTKSDKIMRLILRLRLDKLLNADKLWERLDKRLQKYDYASSSRLVNLCGYWHMKEMFPKSVYGHGTDYPFENLQLRGPDDYDIVLRQMYGDYMTPPPPEKRNHHGTELVSE